jgi:aspartate racemase
MKTIGLIGGMSWESSLEYYRLINEMVKTRLGGFHSAKCLMISVDFAEIEEMQASGRWDEAGEAMATAARSLQSGGADFVVLCTNTMHISTTYIESAITIPFLHIADATGERINQAGLTKVGLLGTRFTMEKDFYRRRLSDRYGLEVVIPDEADRETIHKVIYDELIKGIIRDESRLAYLEIISSLAKKGAMGIILGCTEIGLLVKPVATNIQLFDTTIIHAEAAVEYSLIDK